MKITEISINRSSIVVVIFTILIGAGLLCYQQLGYELVPEVVRPTMTIVTVYPGAAPDEVETNVTEKIEKSLSKLADVYKVVSNSYENFSIISVEMSYETDIDQAIQKATNYINTVKAEMPPSISEPLIEKRGISDLPVIMGGVSSDLPKTEFYDLLDKRLKPKLQAVYGVAKLKLVGGQKREIQVNIDKEKLTTFGLSLGQISQALEYSNMEVPAGKIKNDEKQSTIRVRGKFADVDEIRQLVIVDSEKTGKIKLSDVAEILDGIQDNEIITRINGTESVGLQFLKQSGANAVEMSAKVRESMKVLEDEFKDINLSFTVFNDTTDYTILAADAVMHDLQIAVLLVAAVMLLFLHSLRNALITMVAVPASLISTFSVIYLAGYSLNLMTMLGLSLVVGILVDDAIIVIENIHSHMEKGKSARQASLDAIREIALTVSSITLVIVVVFLPLGLTGGMVGLMFSQFSLVVGFSTMMSLLVAFTLVPFMSSRFARHETLDPATISGKIFGGFEKIINAMIDAFTSILLWALNHKTLTIGVTIVAFFGSTLLLSKGFIGTEAFAQGDRGEFSIQVELPKSSSPKATNMVSQQIETYLNTLPEVNDINTVIGTKETDEEGQSRAYYLYISVQLKEERELSSALFAHKTRLELESKIPGATITTVPVDMFGQANAYKIKLIFQGSDLQELLSYAESVKTAVDTIPGIIRTKNSLEKGAPEVNVKFNREKLATLGLSVGEVGMQMRTAFEGDRKTKFKVGNKEYDIRVRLDNFDRKSAESVASLPFSNRDGQVFKLKQFAEIYDGDGLSQLDRYDKLPSVTVNVQVAGRPSGTVGEEIKQVIAKLDKPSGIKTVYGGDLEMQGESFGRMGYAFLISLALVYLIMVALYDSYITPLVVLCSIPLAIIGALLALALAKQTLSIFTILGIIMLIGLVAKNAIMLVDFANEALKKGMQLTDALVYATKARFRPIFMTTIAMVVGMTPIALSTGAGSAWKNGLAWALIGGLSSSMVLTLIVVPVIFYIAYNIRNRNLNPA
ncbi:multidrug ABC transporter (plasmid) [Fulvitalea axinellae]|uniref:Multidrug ABC transporter n=1 Tax=Fulvitalea axinellae TaxID=1182444 RepID=A0AAU9DE90_9BACT|nr:multidrug ABC transporter [Fulvitalea axinellae]